MPEQTLYEIKIAGRDVSIDIAPILLSLDVTDGTDNEADTAQIELEDKDGLTFLSEKRDPVSIRLGTQQGMGLIFEGFVDEPRSRGDRRSGKILLISCKSVDLGGAAKSPREKHWEGKTLKEILKDAFSQTDITISVAPELASLVLEYEAMDSEDPLSFASRIAKEVGGTFKMMGKHAVLTSRNGGKDIAGKTLPVFNATYGENILDWDIVPIISRASFSAFKNRWYDFDKNKHVEEEETYKGKVPHSRAKVHHGKHHAKQRSKADKGDAERKSSDGSVTTLGSYLPQAGGQCRVSNVRAGVDGLYGISSVTHKLNRSQGWTTSLELKRPQAGAGEDLRISKDSTDTEIARIKNRLAEIDKELADIDSQGK